jgi:hypothetical protein
MTNYYQDAETGELIPEEEMAARGYEVLSEDAPQQEDVLEDTPIEDDSWGITNIAKGLYEIPRQFATDISSAVTGGAKLANEYIGSDLIQSFTDSQDQYNKQSQAAMDEWIPEGSWGRTFRGVGAGLLPALIPGASIGRVASLYGLKGAGSKAGEFLDQGVDPERAALGAGIQGAIDAGMGVARLPGLHSPSITGRFLKGAAAGALGVPASLASMANEVGITGNPVTSEQVGDTLTEAIRAIPVMAVADVGMGYPRARAEKARAIREKAATEAANQDLIARLTADNAALDEKLNASYPSENVDGRSWC